MSTPWTIKPLGPLNMDPAALATIKAMNTAMERYANAIYDDEAEAAATEARRLVPAYKKACEIVGISPG